MTMESTAGTVTASWSPSNEHRRGSVLILPALADTAAAYDGIGAILAGAGYDVCALAEGDDIDTAVTVLGRLPVDRRIPRVVLGSDTGAVTAIRMARTPGISLDALVLAGLPGPLNRRDIEAGPGAVPALVVHGALDGEAPSLEARSLTAYWKAARFVTVADSAHDVLHGPHHRSVALEVTQFLETVRTGKNPLRVSIRSTW
ncbi:alpha/beta hydrolase [Haloechinothrix sp. LS1_15]|uniref:alpha/beta hydrolase n=1 Tax=Haloechinothrix sp. LS1_15 TaxID=2652248 RepID=UPI0029452981|nr:alpha/beta hydrolase [Haloechinothrix sp. LS1_15]MDV6011760.1 alpha/beta hydrolase [Haloechinothrix sp. LS1_15]